jgi:excisionase family DNA binding protein
MANYDSKLGEWFKRLEKTEKELKAKKAGGEQPPTSTPTPRQAPPVVRSAWQPPTPPVERTSPAVAAQTLAAEAEIEPLRNSAAASVDTAEMTSEPREVESRPSLFDDSDAPPVEDFLSFLSRTEEAESVEPFPIVESSRNRGVGRLSEGTGEPRPIAPVDLPVLDIDEEHMEVVQQPVFEMFEPSVAEVIAPEPEPKARSARTIKARQDLQEKWDRMPHHLQTLFGVTNAEEVAQNSYKTFKESRSELIQRLLDPPITLEEAARVLDVCPTTVRRYTNKGILRHFRTAGNQRRFRLSDVLTFMETRGRTVQPAFEGSEG